MYAPGLFPQTFAGASTGVWRIDSVACIVGDAISLAERLDVRSGWRTESGDVWALRGVAGHARYVERREKGPLDDASPPIGRSEATCAALIPIKKSAEWWGLPQDERRAIFEERSRHIADSMRFLPRIARKLFHSRDLGEPFDFLTWFEFAPEHAGAFDELLAMLRSREEWRYVERETEIRVSR